MRVQRGGGRVYERARSFNSELAVMVYLVMLKLFIYAAETL